MKTLKLTVCYSSIAAFYTYMQQLTTSRFYNAKIPDTELSQNSKHINQD